MKQILVAGFGGQGVLFTGKLIAYSGMITGKQVTWMPSYGPEMRGGTTNCGVIVSDKLISTPIVSQPDILLCLNGPSLNKFESKLVPGGVIILDSSLAKRKVAEGIDAHYIPATKLAIDNGLEGLGNMIILGKALKECMLFERDIVAESMINCVSARRQDMVDKNMQALDIGLQYG
jgi:2-oxoglutarate ferredoxin oxidoreductase subunit gamma